MKLIRVIERAGIEDLWPDFLRAYNLPLSLEPERGTSGYGWPSQGERRMERLKDLHKSIGDDRVRLVFERITEAIWAELRDPGYDRLGRAGAFWDDLDDQSGISELESLQRELEHGGYHFESGRLVTQDAPPVGPDLDAVIKIGNRAYLERESARIWAQCKHEEMPCAALFIDIDKFGDFNNQHGHAVGDAVLLAVAQAVQKTVQLRGGLTGRYGGEELVATMGNLTEPEAKSLGERIRQTIERLRVNDLPITVSVGVASSEYGAGSLEELWHQADLSLLRAKETGRNKTVAFTELPSSSTVAKL